VFLRVVAPPSSERRTPPAAGTWRTTASPGVTCFLRCNSVRSVSSSDSMPGSLITSVMPVHSTERAAKLASSGLKPAVRRIVERELGRVCARARCSSSRIPAAAPARPDCAPQHGEQGTQAACESAPSTGAARVDGQVDLAPDLFGQPVEAARPCRGNASNSAMGVTPELGRELADRQRVKPWTCRRARAPGRPRPPGSGGGRSPSSGCVERSHLTTIRRTRQDRQ